MHWSKKNVKCAQIRQCTQKSHKNVQSTLHNFIFRLIKLNLSWWHDETEIALDKHHNFFRVCVQDKLKWFWRFCDCLGSNSTAKVVAGRHEKSRNHCANERETLMNFSGISTFFFGFSSHQYLFLYANCVHKIMVNNDYSSVTAWSLKCPLWKFNAASYAWPIIAGSWAFKTKVKDMCLKSLESSLVANFFLFQLFLRILFPNHNSPKKGGCTDNLFTW